MSEPKIKLCKGEHKWKALETPGDYTCTKCDASLHDIGEALAAQPPQVEYTKEQVEGKAHHDAAHEALDSLVADLTARARLMDETELEHASTTDIGRPGSGKVPVGDFLLARYGRHRPWRGVHAAAQAMLAADLTDPHVPLPKLPDERKHALKTALDDEAERTVEQRKTADELRDEGWAIHRRKLAQRAKAQRS